MIYVDDWAEIRRLHYSEHMRIKTIARKFGLARNTARNAVRDPNPPRYERKPKRSLVDAFKPQFTELLKTCATMPTTVMAARIDRQYGRASFPNGSENTGRCSCLPNLVNGPSIPQGNS